jgi:predicted small metal-binding protein
MKRFACGDVVPDCQATFELRTDDEILWAVTRHAADVHGMSTVPAAVLDQVRSRIVAT